MTEMQLLVPPLEENEHQGDESDMGPNSSSKGSTVLSDELRDQFETMKTVWRRAKRSSGDEAEELRRKQQAVAFDTAVAIDSEMRMWQNGIAELEAMLGEGDDDQEEDLYEEPQGQPQEVIRFPILPPIIPADEDENVGEDNLCAKESSATTTDL